MGKEKKVAQEARRAGKREGSGFGRDSEHQNLHLSIGKTFQGKKVKTPNFGVKEIPSGTLKGFEGVSVSVEVSLIKGIPSFTIVGLGGKAVQESRERVKTALSNIGFKFPPAKIVVNLSPADVEKEGSHFDLPIALGLLFYNSSQSYPFQLREFLVLGELGLDGQLRDTPAIFPIVLALKPQRVIAPLESGRKLSQIPGIELYLFRNLREIEQWKPTTPPPATLSYDYLKINGKKYYYLTEYPLDFSEVKGQRDGKEGALLAAAGFHNLLIEGSPGIGKSMIIHRLRYILPPMEIGEILEVEKLRSLEGVEPTFKPLRPFRAPHHSATPSAIFGGGSRGAKIGEIALAHRGVLFFDELPYFSRQILENLRLPLQEHRMLISRVNSKVEYKTDILFAGAMNPCPCGNLYSQSHDCRCTEREIRRYRGRISQPVLDRIELYIRLGDVEGKFPVSSQQLHQLVLKVFEMNRGKLNSRLPENYQFHYTEEFYHLFQRAVEKFGLSYRSQFNLIKLAKTAANLRGRVKIEREDILWVIRFRAPTVF